MKTFGYDFVFALSLDAVNAILARNLNGVSQTIHYSAVDPESGSTVTMDAQLGPWQIVGGQNSLLNINLPIVQGALSLEGGAITGSYDLSAVTPEMQIQLGWLGPGSPQAATGSGTLTQLIFDPDPSTDPDNPGHVSTLQVHDPQGNLDSVAVGVVMELMASALFVNHSEVSYVLANVDPAPADLASWLAPGEWQYFVSQPTAGTPMLCFLCMLTGGAPFPGTPSFDSTAVQAGSNALLLISQPTFFANVVLPAVRSTFASGTFSMTTTGEQASIANSGDFDVGSVAANSYSLTASPAGNGLAISSGGGGPLKFLFGLANLPDASYSWTVATVNPVVFDGTNLSFAADPNPTVNQDHTIYWYDWVLLVVLGITNVAGLVSAIYDLVNNFADQAQNVGMSTITTDLQAATGGSTVNLAQLVDWKNGETLALAGAGMSEAIYAAGSLSVPSPPSSPLAPAVADHTAR